MDLAKYHALFVEDSTEYLAEIGRRLLELEKAPDSADAIGEIFRMAHSIKGMAASLGYDAVTAVAHRLEDRMQAIRDVGRLSSADELSRLFRGLEGLEGMVAVARDTGEPPPPDPGLEETLSAPVAPEPEAEPIAAPKKKALSP